MMDKTLLMTKKCINWLTFITEISSTASCRRRILNSSELIVAKSNSIVHELTDLSEKPVDRNVGRNPRLYSSFSVVTAKLNGAGERFVAVSGLARNETLKI